MEARTHSTLSPEHALNVLASQRAQVDAGLALTMLLGSFEVDTAYLLPNGHWCRFSLDGPNRSRAFEKRTGTDAQAWIAKIEVYLYDSEASVQVDEPYAVSSFDIDQTTIIVKTDRFQVLKSAT
jgi:hypothetical protein